MTREEINRVNELRAAGAGGKRIAAVTGISLNTIKSYLRRHPAHKLGICLQCGKAVNQMPHKRKKKFCSDACRMAWWKEHPEMIHRKTGNYTCEWCKKEFVSIKRDTCRFCSRACYADARRKVVL